MSKQVTGLTTCCRARRRTVRAGLIALFGAACGPEHEIAERVYVCGTSSEALHVTGGGPDACGANDPNLPPEPTFPSDVCQTIVADKSTPDESRLDSSRIQAAIDACTGRAVKLVRDGENKAFIAGHLELRSTVLWVDEGVTLYASRNPDLYQKTGSCGVIGANDSSACQDFISVSGTSPGIVGDGIIDGQGGEPLVGREYSWWEASGALREIDGSIGNPTLVNLQSRTTGFLMYRITLHNSPKFHVKITSNPADGRCDTPGEGFIVWGVTILTPSRWFNSRGLQMTPEFARNTDGIDPGTTAAATCGVIACNTISTGDDQIAIKGGHLVSDLVIAHNHFGTGHGMSIGSETYGQTRVGDATLRGVQNVLVYDLTIDADSRPVGEGASDADFNGIRIKSDLSRGGLVTNVTFRDVCMRDVSNAILVSTAYNPLFAGNFYPEFGALNFHDVRGVTCMSLEQPVVTIEGHSAVRPAGPVRLDNVVVDNIGPHAVAAEYADIRLGPGDVNFVPFGPGVTLTNEIAEDSPPRPCVFPPLPSPEEPPGWLR